MIIVLGVTLAATPATVMTYITDPTQLTRWQSLIKHAEKITEGDIQKGTQFALELDISAQFPQAGRVLDDLSFDLVGDVVDYTPNRHIAIEGESALLTVTIDFTCEPTDEQTRLTQKTTILFQHPVLKSLAPLAKGLLKRQIKADMANLRQLIHDETA